ncbi:hypothetical protein Q5424_19280 [Conexibacter sp. JD483]|uniref:HD domain-containing protein n=1 Tax=unclassified Conexibacter TaxID=2627773 RepID=UPI00271CAFCD|nr:MULTISPECIES: hypothetical protein [unclassified Conexibacter]MDO8186813.1 hypothetical protein [Conexibacter sp. CPCC 205706]MDO8197433.1 hypothetical protein [Conexibacter sp. CPCC 205762]MDR9371249.1 hypothetical protein [Conexibacter sp. JD483]
MTEPMLEERLKALCMDSGGAREADLDIDLAKIRAAQRKNWDPVLLTWFTDHTPEGHSRRIIGLLGRAIGTDLLTRDELFVLLAACYLHDLGMQVGKVDGRGLDAMRSSDWNHVRRRHPRQSRELIVDRTLVHERDQYEIGLPSSSPFLEAISIVAESHGSEFFDDAIAELRTRDLRPSNESLRLEGVAALLLMGDELDLHKTRVDDLWREDFADLSSIGQLHYHLHHYISVVDIRHGVPSNRRQIRLRFSLPEDSGEDVDSLQEWLGRRLLKQIARTNPILQEQFDGRLEWSDMLEFETEMVRGPVYRPLPQAAREHLQVELTQERLVARTEVRDWIKDAVRLRSNQLGIIGLRGDDKTDLSYLLHWTLALGRAESVVLLHVDFTQRVGHDVRDLSELVSDALSGLYPNEPAPQGDAADLVEVLLDAVAAGKMALVLQAPSRATDESRAWCRELLDRLSERGSGFALVIDDRELDLPDVARARRIKLFKHKHVSSHLHRVLGLPSEVADREAERLMRLTDGAPGAIVYDMLCRVKQAIVQETI